MKRFEILLRVICVLSSLIIIIPGSVGHADDGSVHTEEIVLATESAPGLTEPEMSKLDPLLKLVIQHREIDAQIRWSSPEQVPPPDAKAQSSKSFLEMMSKAISVHGGGREPTVGVLIKTTDNGLELSASGVDIQAKIGDICTANVPIARLAEIARLSSVVYIEASQIVDATNDVSVPETGATQTRADYGVSGEGVIVGYIDTGIDFTHEDFRNPDGSTRIKYLLDFSDPGDYNSDGDLDGPDDFGGTLYTEANINAALAENGRVFPSTDTPLDIPDKSSAGISSHIEVDEAPTIDAVAVDIEIWHSNIDDLKVNLRSPTGTSVMLHNRTGEDANDIIGTFIVSDFNGESAEGTWTLKVSDHSEDYTGDLVSWALRINQVVRQEDNVGHGSHGAGTAAGNGGVAGGEGAGSAVAVGTYAGMAPEADLIVVKATRTDAGSFYTSDVVNALSFIDQKAGELGKPFVANLSLGGHVGPHDGCAEHEQAIDHLVGTGISGKAVVVSAGNEGDEDIHTSGAVRKKRKATVGIDVPSSTYAVIVDAWYPGSEKFGIGFENPQGSGIDDTGLKPGQSGCWVWSIWGIPLYGACVFHEPNHPCNGDKEIQLVLLGLYTSIRSGDWKLYLHGDKKNDSTYDAWALGAEFTDPDPSMRVSMPGTAHNAITVGAYVTKDEWVDVDGTNRECGDYLGCCPQIGDIACFSSDGPTRDGRQKPEITAPGQMIASTYSAHAPVGSRFSMFPYDGWIVQGGRHGVSLGTSFAAPHVTGAVALIMEVNPSLDTIQIRDLLSSTSRCDDFTGSCPSDEWGYGKLDVWTAIGEIIPPTVIAISPDTVPNNTTTDVTITGTNFKPTPTATIDTTPLKNVTYVTSTSLTATVPEGIAPGTYDVTVTNPGPRNLSGTLSTGFTVVEPPTVVAISPDYTCPDTAIDVTITGTNFEPMFTVTIDTTPLMNVTCVTSTTLTATVPAGIAPGIYDVTVTNPGLDNASGTLPDGFTVIGPPTVIAVSPDYTCSNDTPTDLTITGDNFGPMSTVTMDTTPLDNVTYVSPTSLTATVPAGIAAGTYDVTVTNPGPCNLSDTLPDGFTVQESPTVMAISPDTGSSSTTTDVTVTGDSFEPASTVTIGTTLLVDVTYVSSTILTATVPAGITAGTYDVTVTNPGPCNLSDTLPDGFTVMFYIYLPIVAKAHS